LSKSELNTATTPPQTEQKGQSRVERGLRGQLALVRKELAEAKGATTVVEQELSEHKVVPYEHKDLPAYVPVCPGPNCGAPNPNYPGLDKLAKCTNCKSPVGTPDNLPDKCPYCGNTEAEMKENEEEEE